MSDIRALLLTDVVDSTKLSEELGDDAMAEVWANHDRVARDLLPPHKGREIDKTDGMLLLFDTASDAANYAMAYHAALAALPVPLKARAGLHMGPVILRENSEADVARGAKPLEVDGLAKPTAARVMSVAQGAQTLVTAEAQAELGKTELKLQSHGHWMMKGVADPMEIFEVGPQEKRLIAPPDSEKVYRVIKNGDWWMPVKEIPNNLPQQGTNFIGREKELDEVKALLGSARLVTLLGMGGLGKTRLSLQAAAELMHQFPDGVYFLDLAPISDPALALSEAAQVLGVREEPDRTLLQSVSAFLKTKRVLMVFDNCEHLIKASADLAHAVVKAAPNVRLAASSREALRIPGERAYPVFPLAVPKAGDSLEAMRRSTAVQIFVNRAQAVKPAFELNEETASPIAELVARLEGIPLALELAAARVRSLSIADINKRLSDRFKILTGGARVHQERQQTLRALVDWSYDMLPDGEKTLLNRLAVFKGGFDMVAVEAVCGGDPLDPIDVLDLLTFLVEKSLVMMDESGPESRYKMLETIREYAREKLAESGELDAVAAGHCNYFFGISKLIRDGFQGAKQGEWAKKFESDVDNLRAAIALSLAGKVDPFIAVKIAVALQNTWILGGYASEGRSVIRDALALPEIQASEMARGHALYVAATLAQSQGDYLEARDLLNDCLKIRRTLNSPRDTAGTLSTLAFVCLRLGNANEARVIEPEALDLFRQCKFGVGEATTLLQMGQIELYLSNYSLAREFLEESLKVANTVKHPETAAECELVLGQVELESGDVEEAVARISRSLRVCLSTLDRRGACNALWWLGRIDLMQQDFASARGRLDDALTSFTAFEMREQLLCCLEDHAVLALHERSQPRKAVGLASAAENLRQRFGLLRSQREDAIWQQRLQELGRSIGGPEFKSAWGLGALWELEEAVSWALKPSDVA